MPPDHWPGLVEQTRAEFDQTVRALADQHACWEQMAPAWHVRPAPKSLDDWLDIAAVHSYEAAKDAGFPADLTAWRSLIANR